MTEALFFVGGAVFTFFAVGIAVVGVLAFQGEYGNEKRDSASEL
ncbi:MULTISPECIES: hypothetical protein [unclassified Caballeronia]|nr:MULTISPECIES: hypothetical protein [unclassified Caballeronia]